jgi:hypothetical protein
MDDGGQAGCEYDLGASGSDLIPDYRGESFGPDTDVPDYFGALTSPARLAQAIAASRGPDAASGELPRGEARRRQTRKYAQHAAMMLWNPEMQTGRQGLMQQLRAAGAPVGTTSDSVARALSFGPAAVSRPFGLYGSRKK